MDYPSKQDYDNAIWNLPKTVRCAEFQGGVPKNDGFDLEHYTGGYSRVYLIDVQNRTVVLRVWLNPVRDAQSIYVQAEQFFQRRPNPHFVNFRFIPDGIEVNQRMWPILYMEWVNGYTLNRFLDDYLPRLPQQVETVADQFLQMSKNLHQEGVSHGDLQDGNILVTNHVAPIKLKLIDYDTLYISGFKNIKRQTVGVSSYQHPKLANFTIVEQKWDYFSELVIYLSLRAYVEKPRLWAPNQEKALLFSKTDFSDPGNSPVFKTLKSMSMDVRRMAEQLAAYCYVTDPNQILPLEDVVSNVQRAEVPASYPTVRIGQSSGGAAKSNQLVIGWAVIIVAFLCCILLFFLTRG